MKNYGYKRRHQAIYGPVIRAICGTGTAQACRAKLGVYMIAQTSPGMKGRPKIALNNNRRSLHAACKKRENTHNDRC